MAFWRVWESRGCRALGCTGSAGRLHSPFSLSSSSVVYADPPSELLPFLHPGVSSHCCSEGFTSQGCHRTSVSWPRFLQSPFCHPKGHWQLEAGYRSVLPQSFYSAVSLPHGDGPVSAPIHQIWRLDDFSRPSGRLPPGACPPRVSEVSVFLSGRQGLSISGSMLWSVIRTSSLHSCHGRGLLYHTSFWVPDPSLFRRLIGPWTLPAGDRSGEGLPSFSLFRARDSRQSSQELSLTFSAPGLSGDDSAILSFEGFSNSGPGAEGSLSRRRILVLTRAAAQSLAIPPWDNVLSLHSCSGFSAPDAVAPASSSGVSPSGVSDRVNLLGRLLPEGSSVVVRSLPSRGRGGLVSSSSGTHALNRRVRRRVGRVSRLRPSIRLVVSRCLSLFNQPPRAFSCLPCHPGFSPSAPGQVSLSVHRQYVSSVLPPQGRGHALLHA